MPTRSTSTRPRSSSARCPTSVSVRASTSIDFARDDEQLGELLRQPQLCLGCRSHRAHVRRALRPGTGQLTPTPGCRAARCRARRETAPVPSRAPCLRSKASPITAGRSRVWLARWPSTAARRARRPSATTSAQIRERMNRARRRSPRTTLVEAAQLVFTLHSCLHHAGEPTADRPARSAAPAVLRGRSAQPGGSTRTAPRRSSIASGSRSARRCSSTVSSSRTIRSSATWRWAAPRATTRRVRRSTSGSSRSRSAARSPTTRLAAGTPAYNDVTCLCLRAARRLPLNAPCLSLRMRARHPRRARSRGRARRLLSGGAHPILLSDAKMIPGLRPAATASATARSVAEPLRRRALAQHRLVGRRPRLRLRRVLRAAALGHQLVHARGHGLDAAARGRAQPGQGMAARRAGLVPRARRCRSRHSRRATSRRSSDLLDLYFTHLRWMYAKQARRATGGLRTHERRLPGAAAVGVHRRLPGQGPRLLRGRPPLQRGRPVLHRAVDADRLAVGDQEPGLRPTTATTSLPELVDALRCDWGEHMVGAVRERAGGAGAHRGTCRTLPSSSGGGDGATAASATDIRGRHIRRRDHRPRRPHRRRSVHRPGRADRREDAGAGRATRHRGASRSAASRSSPVSARSRTISTGAT